MSALHGLSDIFEANHKRNDKQERQRLRTDIERNSIQVNKRFLDSFKQVQEVSGHSLAHTGTNHKPQTTSHKPQTTNHTCLL